MSKGVRSSQGDALTLDTAYDKADGQDLSSESVSQATPSGSRNMIRAHRGQHRQNWSRSQCVTMQDQGVERIKEERQGHPQSSQPSARVTKNLVHTRIKTKMQARDNVTRWLVKTRAKIDSGLAKFGVTPGGGGPKPRNGGPLGPPGGPPVPLSPDVPLKPCAP